jgi:hypothetical protein
LLPSCHRSNLDADAVTCKFTIGASAPSVLRNIIDI